ncbi:MAG: hypothetical protein QM809_01125 [Gordonia sp. (in: high G+C Gram-positive bacteria)]|uniref:hypothetical protein n=1 Tax=Gordonia sp. (in: high G+C Gram-positive bacteria) TaxID=84139 RepID=UPI0039E45F20
MTTRPGISGGATAPDRIATRTRDTEAVKLRVGGAGFDEIAARLGYPTGEAARSAVRRLLARREATAVEELRAVESARLDTLWRQALATLSADRSPAAITAAVRVSERRARLLGLDAPAEVHLTPPETTSTDIRELQAQILDLLEGPHPRPLPAPDHHDDEGDDDE